MFEMLGSVDVNKFRFRSCSSFLAYLDGSPLSSRCFLKMNAVLCTTGDISQES